MLAVITFAVFHESLRADFVQWDDDINIYANPNIQELYGLHLGWMFADYSYTPRYRPLNWLSWAITYRLFGLKPQAFHLGDLLLHTANALLVFWLMRILLLRFPVPELRNKTWPATVCAGMAALFWAIHPLRVEVVAWTNCRTYTQSLCLLLLSLFCYLRAIESAATTSPLRTFRYWLAVLFLAFSLLTYPIGIAFVMVLLVLNIYPLGRLPATMARGPNHLGWRGVWLEMIPFALVTLPVVMIALWARTHGTGHWAESAGMKDFGWAARVSQAFYIWAYYLWKPWLPFDLSPVYTTLLTVRPTELRFLLSAGLVIGLTVFLVWRRRRWPAALALWLCYLGLLVPMLGLTEHPHYSSDRYSYVPGVLWSVLIAFGLLKLWKYPKLRIMALIASLMVAVILGGASYRQTKIWRNSITLYRYIIAKLGDDPYRYDIYWRLGKACFQMGQLDEAIANYSTALRIRPDCAAAHNGLGAALTRKGRPVEAIGCYREALRLEPDYEMALNNLAWILATHPDGKVRNAEEATRLAWRAVELAGNKDAEALDTLAAAYAEAGKFAQAVQTGRQALALAETAGNKPLVEEIRGRLELYQSQRPYHE